MDVNSIEIGQDFMQAIRSEISRSDIVIVVIGSHWASASDAEGSNRLSAESDPVRIELVESFRQGKRVLPVLVDGAPMPRQNRLPSDIRQLATLKADVLRHETFREDVSRIAAFVGSLAPSPVADTISSRPGSSILRAYYNLEESDQFVDEDKPATIHRSSLRGLLANMNSEFDHLGLVDDEDGTLLITLVEAPDEFTVDVLTPERGGSMESHRRREDVRRLLDGLPDRITTDLLPDATFVEWSADDDVQDDLDDETWVDDEGFRVGPSRRQGKMLVADLERVVDLVAQQFRVRVHRGDPSEPLYDRTCRRPYQVLERLRRRRFSGSRYRYIVDVLD